MRSGISSQRALPRESPRLSVSVTPLHTIAIPFLSARVILHLVQMVHIVRPKRNAT